MKFILLISFLLLTPLGNNIGNSNSTVKESTTFYSDALKIFNFNELEVYLAAKDNSKTYVVNFWATWCAPCVKELPYFEKLNKDYANKKVEVILVSLDFPKHLETKLKPFLAKHKLKSEVILLNDVDSNTWIPKVDKDWSGAIPATIIYNQKKTLFYEHSFEYEELETELKQFLN
ncbi:TlpA disulfide reductase family protein [Olleya sp. YS]|uniref:TlpA disulfide reductase family protein n=1 Tax=Olleya sp. YS TaxID=3028318 RepID=UPI0024344D74|nr:TlpA disulfide reductase family protein [Olleya sp. YS]WGD35166.1 TlpA disulfide reductase family protein [Olleya sp. YS]